METMYLPEGQRMMSASPIVAARNREFTESLAGLERAMETGATVEATVRLCDEGLNLHVDFPALPEVRGIIPREEAAWNRDGSPVKDIAILTRVGKTVAFKVLRMVSEGGITTAYLSRRAAQIECAAHYLDGLIPGDIIPARVTHLENFGAFVDIGCGVASLLSVDTISISRIAHPRDRLYTGQMIWTVVKQVDRAPGRIFVSTRELLGTWEENAAAFCAGQTVAGIVRSVEDYGVFVELAPNLAGLAEIRECDRAAAQALVGRTAAVYIKSILPERMKVKLVLIDAYRSDPVPTPKLTYFIDGERTTHIDRWVYSPARAAKRIESIF